MHRVKDRPIVFVDAQNVTGGSPTCFVTGIAIQLDRKAEFDECMVVAPDSTEETRVLSALRDLAPFTLILDEADRLASPGHKFTPNFLGQCRSLCQDKGIVWISASRQDFQVAFKQTGLTSYFLNDSKRIWVGHLDQPASEKLLSVLGPEATSKIIEQAGGFTYGLQWLGDAWWRRAEEGAESLADSYLNDMTPIFDQWWNHRSKEEKSLLRKAVSRVNLSNVSDKERRALRRLVQQGLAAEENKAFNLPGAAWQDYVRDAN